MSVDAAKDEQRTKFEMCELENQQERRINKRAGFGRIRRSIMVAVAAIFAVMHVSGAHAQQAASGVALPPIIFNTVDFPRKLVAINPDGTGRVEITDGSFDAYLPKWSPDGTKVAFCSQENPFEGVDIKLLEVNSGIVSGLKNFPKSRCNNIDWATNSQEILVSIYVYSPGEKGITMQSSEIYLINTTNPDEAKLIADGMSGIFLNDNNTLLYAINIVSDGIGKIQTYKNNTYQQVLMYDGISLFPKDVSFDQKKILAVGLDVPVNLIEPPTNNTFNISKNGVYVLTADSGTRKFRIVQLIDKAIPQNDQYESYCALGCSFSDDGNKAVYDKTTRQHGDIVSAEIYITDISEMYNNKISSNALSPDWRQ